jgi:Flp pilus assembly protein TadD
MKIFPILLVCGALVATAAAGDLRITLPKKSKPTPVQNLNREGVDAVRHHNYEKAKRLFYKAYLLDPDDPFTLNNLGYIAELEGDVDRAQRFYDLSQQMGSEALVDKSTTEAVVGKPVAKVAGNAAENGMQVNRLNVAAIGLLQKDRAPEADVILTKALAVDATNPFTLNNLGFAKEQEGDLEGALQYYSKAANTNSDEAVVVTVHQSWRGKPIKEIAQSNADHVRDLIQKPGSEEDQVARLNLQGVSALNRNDRRTAREAFQQAYKLKKDDAFTLNNMGYLAEMDGDRETAQYYYEKAQEAEHARAKVGVATRKDAEGHPLQQVAATSNDSVDTRIQQALEQKRREGGPVVLKTRSGQAVVEPKEAKHPAPREGTDVVAIPVPKDNGATWAAPENAAPAANPPNTPTTEQPPQGGATENAVPPSAAPETLGQPAGAAPQGAAPQGAAPQGAQPQVNQAPQAQPPQQQQENPLVQPQELDNPPKPQTSNPPQQPPPK